MTELHNAKLAHLYSKEGDTFERDRLNGGHKNEVSEPSTLNFNNFLIRNQKFIRDFYEEASIEVAYRIRTSHLFPSPKSENGSSPQKEEQIVPTSTKPNSKLILPTSSSTSFDQRPPASFSGHHPDSSWTMFPDSQREGNASELFPRNRGTPIRTQKVIPRIHSKMKDWDHIQNNFHILDEVSDPVGSSIENLFQEFEENKQPERGTNIKTNRENQSSFASSYFVRNNKTSTKKPQPITPLPFVNRRKDIKEPSKDAEKTNKRFTFHASFLEAGKKINPVDELGDVNEDSPPRPSFHLYRLNLDGSSVLLPDFETSKDTFQDKEMTCIDNLSDSILKNSPTTKTNSTFTFKVLSKNKDTDVTDQKFNLAQAENSVITYNVKSSSTVDKHANGDSSQSLNSNLTKINNSKNSSRVSEVILISSGSSSDSASDNEKSSNTSSSDSTLNKKIRHSISNTTDVVDSNLLKRSNKSNLDSFQLSAERSINHIDKPNSTLKENKDCDEEDATDLDSTIIFNYEIFLEEEKAPLKAASDPKRLDVAEDSKTVMSLKQDAQKIDIRHEADEHCILIERGNESLSLRPSHTSEDLEGKVQRNSEVHSVFYINKNTVSNVTAKDSTSVVLEPTQPLTSTEELANLQIKSTKALTNSFGRLSVEKSVTESDVTLSPRDDTNEKTKLSQRAFLELTESGNSDRQNSMRQKIIPSLIEMCKMILSDDHRNANSCASSEVTLPPSSSKEEKIGEALLNPDKSNAVLKINSSNVLSSDTSTSSDSLDEEKESLLRSDSNTKLTDEKGTKGNVSLDHIKEVKDNTQILGNEEKDTSNSTNSDQPMSVSSTSQLMRYNLLTKLKMRTKEIISKNVKNFNNQSNFEYQKKKEIIPSSDDLNYDLENQPEIPQVQSTSQTHDESTSTTASEDKLADTKTLSKNVMTATANDSIINLLAENQNKTNADRSNSINNFENRTITDANHPEEVCVNHGDHVPILPEEQNFSLTRELSVNDKLVSDAGSEELHQEAKDNSKGKNTILACDEQKELEENTVNDRNEKERFTKDVERQIPVEEIVGDEDTQMNTKIIDCDDGGMKGAQTQNNNIRIDKNVNSNTPEAPEVQTQKNYNPDAQKITMKSEHQNNFEDTRKFYYKWSRNVTLSKVEEILAKTRNEDDLPIWLQKYLKVPNDIIEESKAMTKRRKMILRMKHPAFKNALEKQHEACMKNSDIAQRRTGETNLSKGEEEEDQDNLKSPKKGSPKDQNNAVHSPQPSITKELETGESTQEGEKNHLKDFSLSFFLKRIGEKITNLNLQGNIEKTKQNLSVHPNVNITMERPRNETRMDENTPVVMAENVKSVKNKNEEAVYGSKMNKDVHEILKNESQNSVDNYSCKSLENKIEKHSKTESNDDASKSRFDLDEKLSNRNSKLINVYLSEPLLKAYNMIESCAKPFLKALQDEGGSPYIDQKLNKNKAFHSLTVDKTRFILNELVKNRTSKDRSRKGMELEDRYRKSLILHGLVKAADLLLHCTFEASLESLRIFLQAHHTLIEGNYDDVIKNMSELLQATKEMVIHPKVVALQKEISSSETKQDQDIKVLVVAARKGSAIAKDLSKTFGQSFVNHISKEDETQLQTVFKILEKATVLVWSCDPSACMEAGQGLPLTPFSLVVEWESKYGFSSPLVERCLRQNIPVVSLACQMSNVNEEEGTSVPLECLKAESKKNSETYVFIASEKVVANAELHYILTSIFSIEIVERRLGDFGNPNLGMCGGWADIVIDERTCVLLQPLHVLRQDEIVVRLIQHLVLLYLQYLSVYVILYISPQSSHGYAFRGNVVKALVRLVSTCAQFKSEEYSVNLLYAHNYHQIGSIVRSLGDIARASSRVLDQEDWVRRPWLASNMSSHEKFLLSFPCINPIAAQIMLTALPLTKLLTADLDILISSLPWIPEKIIVMFHKMIHRFSGDVKPQVDVITYDETHLIKNSSSVTSPSVTHLPSGESGLNIANNFPENSDCQLKFSSSRKYNEHPSFEDTRGSIDSFEEDSGVNRSSSLASLDSSQFENDLNLTTVTQIEQTDKITFNPREYLRRMPIEDIKPRVDQLCNTVVSPYFYSDNPYETTNNGFDARIVNSETNFPSSQIEPFHRNFYSSQSVVNPNSSYREWPISSQGHDDTFKPQSLPHTYQPQTRSHLTQVPSFDSIPRQSFQGGNVQLNAFQSGFNNEFHSPCWSSYGNNARPIFETPNMYPNHLPLPRRMQRSNKIFVGVAKPNLRSEFSSPQILPSPEVTSYRKDKQKERQRGEKVTSFFKFHELTNKNGENHPSKKLVFRKIPGEGGQTRLAFENA